MPSSSSDLSGSEVTLEQSLRGNERDFSSVESSRRQAQASAARERRKKMRTHLSELQEMVPTVQNIRADKVTIVEETIKYIKFLEDRVEEMLNLNWREALVAQTLPQSPEGFDKSWVFPNNVSVDVSGEKALFTVWFPNNNDKRDLYNEMCDALLEFNIQISCVTITTDKYKTMYKLHAHYAYDGEENSDGSLYGEALEEMFKRAARELYLLCPM